MAQIGAPDIAERIAAYHHGLCDCPPADCEQIGQGSHRTVYLDHLCGTVYKVGDDRANRREVRTLADLRSRGVGYAPAATLYEVAVADGFGDTITATVVAMPYLPDDGSVPRPYPVLNGAADLNPDSVVANRGRLWLIDAGGL